jgi:hypothetical protein
MIAAATAWAGSVEGAAIEQLRSLIATNDAAGLYDFLNQPSLRGKIDSTPEVESIAIAAIRAAPGNRGGGSTRRRFFAALRGYRATEIFRYLIATYQSDLTDVNPASGGLNYSILREDADNLLAQHLTAESAPLRTAMANPPITRHRGRSARHR